MRLPGNGLVLVAGANNAGKTALLSAFDAITGDYGDGTSLRPGGSEEPARLRATFDLDEAERTAILENAADGWALLNAGVLSSLQLVYEQWKDQGLKVREVLGSWAGLGLRPLVRMRPDPPGGQYIYEVIGAFHQGDGREAQSGEVLDVSGEALRVLAAVSGVRGSGEFGLDGFLSGEGALAPIWAPMIAWRTRFYHFRALRTGTQRSQQLSSPEKLDPTGNNLAGVLHYLATDRRHLFEQGRDLIAQVVPDIGTLQVRTGGNNMRVVFESGAGDTVAGREGSALAREPACFPGNSRCCLRTTVAG